MTGLPPQLMAINRGKQYTEVNSDSNRMLHLYYNDQYLDNQLETKKDSPLLDCLFEKGKYERTYNDC